MLVKWGTGRFCGVHLCAIPQEKPDTLMWLENDKFTWWRHQMGTFSALLALCAGNSQVTGEFPAQRPVTRSFDVFLDLGLNKRLSKQSWSWSFETPSRPLWRYCNVRMTVLWHFQPNDLMSVSYHIYKVVLLARWFLLIDSNKYLFCEILIQFICSFRYAKIKQRTSWV